MSQRLIKSKGKVFRDPIHRLVRIEQDDQFILELINTRVFQRLRRIRQLGVSSLTYHGAEHSRFVHSLGVFNFAQRIVANLMRRYPDTEVAELLQGNRRVALAAALLHDIGHGPFSHMIERVKGNNFEHEKMTSKLIREENGEIANILISYDISPKDVADVIDNTFPHMLITDIVSSQLDADRMDYLLRDSLMTGVEYGVYDAEWLLNSMCVGLEPTSRDINEKTWRLCLDKNRGLFAAEQLILARHHMMLQVYMHRVTRGYEVMLLNLFQQASEIISASKPLPKGTPSSIIAYFREGINMQIDDWLFFDESAMVAAFQCWSKSSRKSDKLLGKLASAYLNREHLYKAIEIGIEDVPKTFSLEGKLEEAGLKKFVHWGLDNGEHLPYKGVYHQASKGGEGEEESVLSILLSEGKLDSKGTAIEHHSEILKGMDNKRQAVWRLYVDSEYIDKTTAILKDLKIKQRGVL